MTDETWWNDHHEEPGVPRDAWRYAPRMAVRVFTDLGAERGAGKSSILSLARPLLRARILGAEHGAAGATPYGDLDADDSALMTALGETSPTTEHNHPRRLALLQAYRDAYQQATETI